MTVLVIDVGSSSARALLFDDEARLIPGAVASRVYPMTTTPPGAAILDALELGAHVEACIDSVLAHPAAGGIRAVGMATLVSNVLGIDASGEAVTPIYTYADTRSADDVDALKRLLQPDAVHQQTGCILHTAYQPGRLRWLRRTEPALFEQAALWVDFATYLYRRWFGAARCSYSVASWSGLLNRADLTWSRLLLDVLDLDPARLPPLADYERMQQGLTPLYASRWPALRDAPFYLAVGDGAAANVGSGCVDATRVALTVGTTAALRVISHDNLPPVPSGLWGYRLDARHHLIGGATSEGGNIFAWVRDTFRLDNLPELDEQLACRAPDSHGLTFLPLLAGERSPGWSAEATGTITGLRLSTTSLDVLHAALEGVALRLSLIFDQIAPMGGDGMAVVGGGGALAASPAWARIIANALNVPLHVTEEPEITARGVALLVLRALDGLPLSNYPPALAYTIEPSPAHANALLAARERQAALYNQLILKGVDTESGV